MKPAPISHKEAAALGWIRTDPKPWGELAARWAGPDGWELRHCGHPTAHWPWALYDPKGRMHFSGATGQALNPTYGYAWANLREPMQYVAEHRAWAMRRMDQVEAADRQAVRR
jgi:hypothetical protein